MAMVVMVYHGHEAISFIVAIAMVVMGGMCVQSIRRLAMAMVVMGGTCVQSITAIRNIRLLCW